MHFPKKQRLKHCLPFICALSVGGCNSPGGSDGNTDDASTDPLNGDVSIDISNAVFDNTSADCADYANDYVASVSDVQRNLAFTANVSISASNNACTLNSDSIPNHDFNDSSAHFATNVTEIQQSFSIPRNPSLTDSITPLSQRTYNAVMLNGVVLDLLSAGCYRPNDFMADQEGNVPIGCNNDDLWLLDPLGTESGFGTDEHNAHTQPNGLYHYHGNPHAMFDANFGPNGSPVIGFAADGFPIYGSYFYDENTGSISEAHSGYTLKAGTRPNSAADPGGNYDGMYIDDWEFTDAGNLDECNGRTVNGHYGYYVTDSYPWVMGCLSGSPDNSFNKF